MAKYELMFITRADVPDDEIDKLTAQMDTVVSGAGGKTEKIDRMGRRRLAYRVKKQREGFYILFTFDGNGDTVRPSAFQRFSGRSQEGRLTRDS